MIEFEGIERCARSEHCPKVIDPKVFADYLLTLGIKTRVDDRPDGWHVWIYNEDHLGKAGEELQGI